MNPNPYFKGSGKTNSYTLISIKHIFNYVDDFENRMYRRSNPTQNTKFKQE